MTKSQLSDVRSFIAAGQHQQAFAVLSELADPEHDFAVQSRYLAQFAKISDAQLKLKKIKVALIGTTTLDHISSLLRFYLAREGFDAEVYLAPFGTLIPEILNPDSDLYRFQPNVIWIFSTHRDVDLTLGSPRMNEEEAAATVSHAADRWTDLWAAIKNHCNSAIIQNNCDIPWVRSFGNYDGTAVGGRVRLMRRFNETLACRVPPSVTIFDLDHISAIFGKRQWYDARFWHHSKHAFSLDAAGEVAFHAAKQIVAIYGQSKKCLVLDLDNTIWGGVIADDGLAGILLGNGAAGEAFVEFQDYLLQLKRRGILLAVCSKNNEETAQEVFLKHPDMKLKTDDISLFMANWNNKADNISEIARRLNIGLDSMVFIDDNPAERALVREMLPAVSVPELPTDPSEYVRALEGQMYFETTSFSKEDEVRSDYYRENVQRSLLQEKSTDVSDFLKGLQMESEWGMLDAFHLPRFTQLINKSNQFHLTTTRHTESEISAMALDHSKWICLYFKLKDRFGDNGLISTVVLERTGDEEMSFETWAMSCRVLSRTMEEFILARVRDVTSNLGVLRLYGKYIPTPKNKLVSMLYPRLGFRTAGLDGDATLWQMDLPTAPATSSFIKSISSANPELLGAKVA